MHDLVPVLQSAHLRRILTVSRVELVFLIGVVWNMVVKPVGQPRWFWRALVVMAAAALALAAVSARGGPESSPTPADA